MIKKIISLLLVAVTMLSMAGCSMMNNLNEVAEDFKEAVNAEVNYTNVLEEFKEFLNKNETLKNATNKQYSIKNKDGEMALPDNIKTLEELFAANKENDYIISATFAYENEKDFCPENIDLSNVSGEFSNYKITLYNTKNGQFKESVSGNVANYNTNILDRIEYNINVVDQNKKDDIVPLGATDMDIRVNKNTDSTQETQYEQFVSVIYKHMKYEIVDDLTFVYDDRFFDIKIEEAPKMTVPNELLKDTIYRYNNVKKSYDISFTAKTPNVEIQNTSAQFVNYKHKTQDNIIYTVTEYHNALNVIYSLDEYKNLIPYYTSVVLPTKITNKDYVEIDLSAIDGQKIYLGFFSQEANIHT